MQENVEVVNTVSVELNQNPCLLKSPPLCLRCCVKVIVKLIKHREVYGVSYKRYCIVSYHDDDDGFSTIVFLKLLQIEILKLQTSPFPQKAGGRSVCMPAWTI
jgi:hypothetical protein